MHYIAKIFLFLQLNNILSYNFFNDDELGHVRLAREDVKQNSCNENKLIDFLAELQVINPESVMKLATLTDLEPTCKRIEGNLNKVTEYLKTCTPSTQPNLYIQLINGVESLHNKICKDNDFRKEFEKDHKCFNELKSDFENCNGPADWNENSDDKEICRAYQSIVDCYYIKAAKVCGKPAAQLIKDLINSVIDSIITVKCDTRKVPKVSDIMPDNFLLKSKDDKITLNINIKLIIILIQIIIMFQ